MKCAVTIKQGDTMYKAINGWTKAKILKVLKARRYNCAAASGQSCFYLTKNGNRCAVGLFIPKGHEGTSLKWYVKDLLQAYPDLEGHMPLETVAMRDLQGIHDGCAGEENLNAKQAMINWVKDNVE
jgi:hypothetical protein